MGLSIDIQLGVEIQFRGVVSLLYPIRIKHLPISNITVDIVTVPTCDYIIYRSQMKNKCMKNYECVSIFNKYISTKTYPAKFP